MQTKTTCDRCSGQRLVRRHTQNQTLPRWIACPVCHADGSTLSQAFDDSILNHIARGTMSLDEAKTHLGLNSEPIPVMDERGRVVAALNEIGAAMEELTVTPQETELEQIRERILALQAAGSFTLGHELEVAALRSREAVLLGQLRN